LSETIATIAQNGDEPIDRFMLYYAKHFRESNSQWSQDMFVSWTLGRCTKGTFLEMGGADGVTHSNTLSLEDHFHWRGTLIEPHPEQYRILSNTRGNRANRLMNCAATPATSEETLELIDAGQLSSLSNYIGRDLHQNNRTNSQRLHSV
ncbi:MAG: hypothetical protein ACKPHU_30995, partial [Planctomycetaceae bacterium]